MLEGEVARIEPGPRQGPEHLGPVGGSGGQQGLHAGGDVLQVRAAHLKRQRKNISDVFRRSELKYFADVNVIVGSEPAVRYPVDLNLMESNFLLARIMRLWTCLHFRLSAGVVGLKE